MARARRGGYSGQWRALHVHPNSGVHVEYVELGGFDPRRRGAFLIGWRGKIAFIHPDDIAEVVVATLSHGKALHDALVITGPEALSYREMTAAIGEVTSDSIHYDTLSDDDAMMGVSMRADRPYAEALVDIWRVREGRLTTVSDGLQQLLGRASKSFSDWIGENISYFAERTGRSR